MAWRRNSAATFAVFSEGRVAPLRLQGVQAGRERVGVADAVAEPLAPEPDDQAVFADGLDQGLDPLDLHPGPELVDELLADLGRDPARPGGR